MRRPPARRRKPSAGGTLVYCTAYATTPALWRARFRTWVDAVQEGLGADQILIVDDGSPMLPGWADTRLSSGAGTGDAENLGRPGGVMLHHFSDRLGRSSNLDFPGWYSFFAFGAIYGAAHGFDRVMHIESDAFLISDRSKSFFRDFADGWAALWCGKYNFPESALQVAAGAGVASMRDFASLPYEEKLAGRDHEQVLPLTHVERGFAGDRWGENAEAIPPDADYVAQVQSQREPSYYWWLKRAGGLRAPRGEGPGRVDLDFGAAGNATQFLVDGWGGQEPDLRWMLAYQSVLSLPPLEFAGAYALRMTVLPHVAGARLPHQRVLVNMNGTTLDEFVLSGATTVGCSVPARLLKRDGTDRLRLIHPDAQQPSALDPANGDRRRLSLALMRLSMVPEDGV